MYYKFKSFVFWYVEANISINFPIKFHYKSTIFISCWSFSCRKVFFFSCRKTFGCASDTYDVLSVHVKFFQRNIFRAFFKNVQEKVLWKTKVVKWVFCGENWLKGKNLTFHEMADKVKPKKTSLSAARKMVRVLYCFGEIFEVVLMWWSVMFEPAWQMW